MSTLVKVAASRRAEALHKVARVRRNKRGWKEPYACPPETVLRKETNKQDERKIMTNKFDDIAKGLAQSVTRRQALKRFGVGLAGMALACFGLASRVDAAQKSCLPLYSPCGSDNQCCSGVCSLLVGKKGSGGQKFCYY